MVDMGVDKTMAVVRQAELLGVNRSSLYYKPVPVSERELLIRHGIDAIYTEHPEYGYRRIKVVLGRDYDLSVSGKTVLHHMREMGIQAIYPGPNTSKPAPGHVVYPYLLANMKIDRPNQVWSTDITYIPLRAGWLYLVAFIDWHSRYVLSWKLSDTLKIDFVIDAANEALKNNMPEIINTDQGSHFTSAKFIEIFLKHNCKISMDHRGRAFDNIFVERLWRTIKYENVYLMNYETPRETYLGLEKYINHYNYKRPHQSLNYKTPYEVHTGKV